MPKITFQIEAATPVVIEANAGDNLLELARRANVAIDAPCSGNGSCGKCRVKLVEGSLETIPSRHITEEEFDAGWRLSCNCKVVGDCTVFVPDIASAYQSRMKTADLSSPQEVAIFEACQQQLKESGISFENQYRAVVVSMAAPSLDDTMPDNERLTWPSRRPPAQKRWKFPSASWSSWHPPSGSTISMCASRVSWLAPPSAVWSFASPRTPPL